MAPTRPPARRNIRSEEARAWVLLLLAAGPAHGWDLRSQLRSLGLSVDGPTLYRALRALEDDDGIRGGWEPGVTGPDRKVYVITDRGRRQLDEHAEEFGERRRALTRFLRLHRERLLGTGSP